MADELLEMPFLRNIGLIVTYKCQIACPHCIIEAGPHRREEMLLDDARKWIKQIAGYANGYIKVLSLTGGEPFYDIDKLKIITECGEANGLMVSAVTNAFWAKTPDDAVNTLKGLPYIKMLAISTDVYHQESIPFENIKNAIKAANECGVPYNIAVCTENEYDAEYKKVISQLEAVTDRDTILTAVTFPAGRALKKVHKAKYQMTSEPPISACSAGSSPIVLPDGRIIACIGPVIDLSSSHPLVLGNLCEQPLSEVLDEAEINPILHSVRVWGPRKLVSLLESQGLEDILPVNYIKGSVCNACYALMSDRNIVSALTELAQDYDFIRKVAYARLYYLKEPKMLELLARRGVIEPEYIS